MAGTLPGVCEPNGYEPPGYTIDNIGLAIRNLVQDPRVHCTGKTSQETNLQKAIFILPCAPTGPLICGQNDSDVIWTQRKLLRSTQCIDPHVHLDLWTD